MERGRLVVFEGGEGVGKSTQAASLAQALDALLTREPGGVHLGEFIRSVLLEGNLGTISPRAELFLMLADRAQHVEEVIRPTLESGRDVVCDRYSGSTIAYQGYGRGLPLNEVAQGCTIAEHGVQADLSVLLDAPVEVSLKRLAHLRDRIEAEDQPFHERVREGFRELADGDPGRWIVIDATNSADEVRKQVTIAVAERLAVLS